MQRDDDIEAVLRAATHLGKALSTSDRHMNLQAVRTAVENDAEASQIFTELDAIGRKIQSAAAAGQEPEIEDREALEEKKNEARANPHLQDLLRAQADYVELLLAMEQAVFTEAPRMGHRLV